VLNPALLLGATPLNPVALALFARMTTQPPAKQKRAYSNFFATPGVIPFLARQDRATLLMGGTEQAGLLDLTGRSNFTKAGTVQTMPWRGMFTDGSTGSLATAAIMNALTHYTQNDASAWAFITESKETNSDHRALIGQNSAATSRMRMAPHNGTGSFTCRANDAVTLTGLNGGVLTGLFSLNRNGANDRSFWRGDVVLGSDTQVSSALVAQEIMVFRDGATFCSNSPVLGAMGCGSMTLAEALMFQTALQTLYTDLTPDPVSSGVTSLTFQSSTTLPDGQGSFAGKGFTGTGLCLDPVDNTFWGGNYGRQSDQDPATNTPAIVHLASDRVTKLAEFDMSAITTTDGPQGVAVDTVNGVVGWVAQASSIVRTISKTTGAQVSSFDVGIAANALAWDSTRLCWIVGRAAAATSNTVVEWRSTAGVLLFWVRVTNNPDHFWYDAAKDQLWMSYGSNGVDGLIDIFDIGSRSVVKTLTLTGSLAVEGIVVVGSTLYQADDARYHIGSSSVNAIRSFAIA
jgi:hypothetical protein